MKNIGEEFLQATILENCQDTARSRGEQPPVPEVPYAAAAKLIELPEPELLPDQEVNFLELIELRSTVREYSGKDLSLKELSFLLWCTQGVKMGLPGGGTMRNVPSAGARHALETYLYLKRVEGLEPGLYRFLPLEHALLLVDPAAERLEAVADGFKAGAMVRNSAVTFIWTAELQRMEYMFGARAWRYLFLDAGHVCQNLYLAAQTRQIGVCAVGAFYDDKLNAALALDGTQRFAVYAATAGKL